MTYFRISVPKDLKVYVVDDQVRPKNYIWNKQQIFKQRAMEESSSDLSEISSLKEKSRNSLRGELTVIQQMSSICLNKMNLVGNLPLKFQIAFSKFN